MLLTALVLVILIGCGLGYVVALDLAAAYPEVAHLRIPFLLAIIAGLVPVGAGIVTVFGFLGLVDRGEAFSPHTLRLLRRLALLLGITAAYLLIGAVGVWLALLPLQSPSIILAWFVAEVVTLFLLVLVVLVERLFAAALELRRDSELTV